MFVPNKMRLNDFEEVIISTPREMLFDGANLSSPSIQGSEEIVPPSMSKLDTLMSGMQQAEVAARHERQRQAAAAAAAAGAKNDGENSDVHKAALAVD